MKLKPPRDGADLRKRVMAEFRLNSAPAMALLDCAAQALDLALSAEKILAAEGLVVNGSRGPKPHPAANLARDARNRMVSALKALNLEL